ncbi:hypothetical protein VTK73DRAFT_7136 [Phialemonium thermophilum]|uniref:Cyclase n=1 Tax=Phialemonium thermophilum TaxID=223376 RepID=A0ABR3WG46_9PEZI
MASGNKEIEFNGNGIPSFDALPLRKDAPFRAAWGLYGDHDELGTLNRLTDERVAAAAKSEIKTGVRVSLNWALDAQKGGAFFKRQTFHHEILPKHPATVNDDIWTFNSQGASQWDGLRHYGYQKEKVFYNGVTMDDIHNPDEHGKKSTVNGIQAWAEKGIVGRGVLVDFHRWRLQQRDPRYMKFDPFDRCPISFEDLQACLAAQGTEVKFGDILIVRSGWMLAHASKTPEQLAELQAPRQPRFCGVEQDERTLRWIWDNFAAVAGDHPTFECWPATPAEGVPFSFHEVLLSGWGCPLGELFDLERLAAHCEREGRWSFFVTSEPCNVTGGVASPPNILAIF